MEFVPQLLLPCLQWVAADLLIHDPDILETIDGFDASDGEGLADKDAQRIGFAAMIQDRGTQVQTGSVYVLGQAILHSKLVGKDLVGNPLLK